MDLSHFCSDLLKDFTKSCRSGRRPAVPEIQFAGEKGPKSLSEKMKQMSVDDGMKNFCFLFGFMYLSYCLIVRSSTRKSINLTK